MIDKDYVLRIQTFLKSKTREDFLLDMSDKGLTSSELARQIISQHYGLVRMESNERAKKLIEA